MYTLITGASSGIGYELAKVFVKNGHNIILTARRQEKLESLKSELEQINKNISIFIITEDLAQKGSAKRLYDKIQEKKLKIEILVNNAGFGDFGLFEDANLDKLERMIHLNISTLSSLSKLFLPEMIERKKGKILNTASTAAFQAVPYMAVYAATKAYVESFSEAIAEELKEHNIDVMSLCPGPTKSEFGKQAGVKENSNFFKDRKYPTSAEVAQFAYKKLMQRKRIAIHGFKNKLIVFGIRFIPRKWVSKMAMSIIKKV
jgi:uncharacterized protein